MEDEDKKKDLPDGSDKDKDNGQDDVLAQFKAEQAEKEAAHKKEMDDLKKSFESQKQNWIKQGEDRAKMSADEKAKADFEEKQKALDAKIAQFESQQALSETKAKLSDSGISSNFAKYLSDTDEDKRNQNIDEFSKAFNAAVQKAVEDKVAGKTNPVKPNSTVSNDLDKEKWEKLPYDEQSKIYRENPELAKKFM